MTVSSMETDVHVGAMVETEVKAKKRSWHNWALGLLLTLGPILLLGLYNHRMVAGLISPEAMDHAQLGRNLLAGHGFTTHILRSLALTDSANPLAQPDLTHGPLYPFLLDGVVGDASAFHGAAARDPCGLAVRLQHRRSVRSAAGLP